MKFVCRKCKAIVHVSSIYGHDKVLKYYNQQLCPQCMYPNIYSHLDKWNKNCETCKKIEKSFWNKNITDKDLELLEEETKHENLPEM